MNGTDQIEKCLSFRGEQEIRDDLDDHLSMMDITIEGARSFLVNHGEEQAARGLLNCFFCLKRDVEDLLQQCEQPDP